MHLNPEIVEQLMNKISTPSASPDIEYLSVDGTQIKGPFDETFKTKFALEHNCKWGYGRGVGMDPYGCYQTISDGPDPMTSSWSSTHDFDDRHSAWLVIRFLLVFALCWFSCFRCLKSNQTPRANTSTNQHEHHHTSTNQPKTTPTGSTPPPSYDDSVFSIDTFTAAEKRFAMQ